MCGVVIYGGQVALNGLRVKEVKLSKKQANKRYPRAGIGVLVIEGNDTLLGETINAHGFETWCPPGCLEFGESPQECAARELY